MHQNDALYRSGADPKRVQRGRAAPRKGAEDNRTATALGDVAWAAAGVLGPRNILPVGPQPLPMCLCCAVMTQSPHITAQGVSSMCLRAKDHLRTPSAGLPAPNRKSRLAAQRSAATRGVATLKAMGDPATHERAGDPACEKEQCVGTCDRSLEEGAAHKCCVTPPSRSQLRPVAAEQGMPAAQPTGYGSLPPSCRLLEFFRRRASERHGGELHDGSPL